MTLEPDPSGPIRSDLLEDRSLRGRAFCRAHSARMDEWLVGLFDRSAGDTERVSLAAVGGYGRNELCPHSDLDLVLLHDSPEDSGAASVARLGVIESIADGVWYPIWDAGLKLGHAVRSVEQVDAVDDLETATALLALRHLAGDESLTERMARRVQANWAANGPAHLAQLRDRSRERHRSAGEVAFLLEPDLKTSRGGLRDIATLRWIDRARPTLGPRELDILVRAEDRLLDARVALHRLAGRSGDLLTLQEQDGVADDLGHADADALMRSLSQSARAVGWLVDDEFDRIDRLGTDGHPKPTAEDRVVVAPGVEIHDRRVLVTGDITPHSAPGLVVSAAVAAGTSGLKIDRGSLELLANRCPPFPEPWPDDLRDGFIALLRTGDALIDVVEALDHWGLFERMLPEWVAVRCKPQRNAYHTFTVDRHLCVAAANAAAVSDRVTRPDLLAVGALLHDIGKGLPGDHTDVGMDLVRQIGPRLGFPDADTEALVDMVRHHLLLPDVATRRDVGDEATIETVARSVGSTELLELLDALTEADSKATGPSAWSDWKAQLVRELVARTSARLTGAEHPVDAGEGGATAFPSDAHRALLGTDRRIVEHTSNTLTVIDSDRPGMFSRLAGVMALSGLEVQGAAAFSTRDRALSEFTVVPTHGTEIPWERVEANITAALDGRLAVRARLAARARDYARPSVGALPLVEPDVIIDNDASAVATVIEVRAPDAIGLLYRITTALAELDLDIRSAKVQTLGADVVDSFYVRSSAGEKIIDADHQAELLRALRHALADSGIDS